MSKETAGFETLTRSEERLRRVVSVLQRNFSSNQEMLDFALEEAIQLTRSKIGYIYHYCEEKCEFILNTWSKEVMPACAVTNPQSCYELSKTGIWGEAVRQRKTIIVNDFNAPNSLKKGIPKGHVSLQKFMTVPVFSAEKIVGVVGVANKESDYNELDALQLQLLMQAVWQKSIQMANLDELKKIEWMLSHDKSLLDRNHPEQGYADLTELNHNGAILSSIGKSILEGLVEDYLDLLDTSTAIYEKNGDYALGIFASNWCRFLDQASRKLCRCNDDKKALASGKWLCHESCWTDCCKIAIAEERPVDVLCHGGLHLYALPVYSKGKVVGAVNFGYGDPPRDQASLKRIADAYNVAYDELLKLSSQYLTRPQYMISTAKKRLKSTALLIGSLVETRQAENQLLHAMKMEAIGRLAGGVAHDFNNMLGVILGHAEMALLETETSEIVRNDLENIIAAATRSTELTRHLLAFARKQPVAPRIINLNKTISNLQTMLKRLIGENIELIFHPGPENTNVLMDPAQLDQILANLVVNSRDAIESAGQILIEIDVIETEEMVTYPGQKISAGRYAVLTLSDNGSGMSHATQMQIFEPFYTTKPEGKGTGLGLPTVYGIVEQNHGGISVFSEENIGTTMKIYLPTCIENSQNFDPKIKSSAPLMGHETILVVEDEFQLLRLTKSMLEKLGYHVISFNSPLEAFAAVKDQQIAFDLILSDVVMPNMNGPKMIDQILAIRPESRYIFMTGYAPEIISKHIVKDSVIIIEKPFSLFDLSRKIREALDQEKST